jgi:PhnB protein
MSKVKAVPEGYHTLTTFLNIEGADKAIEFYKKAFGAEERARMPGPGGKIMHAELKIGDSMIMLSDAMMEPATQGSTHIYVNDVDTWFNRAVAAGAKVLTPLADMFWGDRYGRLQDPFGNKWSIATHKEDVPPEEMRTRAQAFMAQMAQQKK